MNALEGVPSEVCQFIDSCIDSIEQLEVLLLLWRSRPQALAPQAINRDLGSSLESITRRLDSMSRLGLVERLGVEFRYSPEPTKDAIVERVAQAYRERRVSVITYVVNRPNQSLRAFADAFRLRDPRSH
jgi:DNA-binding IclR family transcriptional regulator